MSPLVVAILALSRPITSGAPDDADPAVVGLVAEGEVFCTATLIAPDTILTAAHCLAGRDPARLQVFFGADPAAGGENVDVIATTLHPGFERATLAHDLALATLAHPVDVAPAALLAAAPEPMVGRPVRLVGFGLTSAIDESAPRKRSGWTSIASASERSFDFAPAPSGTCRRDSGGPAFVTLDGREWLAGVTSAGDPACVELGRDVRVDAYADDFLAAYVGTNPPTRDDITGGCGIARSRPTPPGFLLILVACLALHRRACR